MRLSYTNTPREHDAGILEIGYAVSPIMVVPPNAKNFTIGSIVTADCTSEVYILYAHIERMLLYHVHATL